MSAYLLTFLSLCLPVNPSVFKPLCQGVRQYVSRIVCQYLCLSVFYIHPSGRLSICVSLCKSVSQSVCLFVHQCGRLPFCLSCCQSVFLYVGLCVFLFIYCFLMRTTLSFYVLYYTVFCIM